MSYRAGFGAGMFVEPFAVGDAVPEMPLFLSDEIYVEAPLEAAYLAAWEGVPPPLRGDVPTA